MIATIKHWLEAIREYDGVVNEFGVLVQSYSTLQEKYVKVSKKYLEVTTVDELEKYWNERRVKVNRQHKARDGVNMDVRCFFQRDCTLIKFSGSPDEVAKKAQSYVVATVKYVSDSGEFWQYSYETKLVKTGDCDDMGIYVANLLYNNGVPAFRVRLNKGYVEYKGSRVYHVWCTYLAEDNEWYVLDAAYWSRESAGLKLKWKDAEKYLTVDASWTAEHSFGGLSK